ncbi:endolytic transglycosylase MltG [Nonomuraea longicatena]|uniref:Endolytic murein transglycosylase n=1 Tax=Nonomuraea longicatena TaxID=83682 RepID=A0ABN1Q9R0_9ACTN
MNIESLLRETLSEMADEERPPAPDRFLQVRERRPDRRRVLALAAAAAVAAMAVGSTLVVQAISSQGPGEVAAQRTTAPSPATAPRTVTVTVTAGMRLSQVFKALSSLTGRPVADFEKAAEDGTTLGLPSYAGGRLEGFLSPGAYEISPAMSAREILRTMVSGFRSAGLVEGAERIGRTPLEILTVASIVQAEAVRREDMPKIARVIYNRLERRMPLQIDSTVLYGLGKSRTAATLKDLRTSSPYNTYRHLGLPPTPIGNPGEDAIRAALKPAPGAWLYFVATDPKKGVMKFTASGSEFAELVEEHRGNQRTW